MDESSTPAAARHDASDVRDLVRIRMDFGYDGAPFHGMKALADFPTVAGTINVALGQLLEPTCIEPAGFTDKGVHAERQVAHFDVRREVWERNSATFLADLAGALPEAIAVQAAAEVPLTFDARKSATARHYRYSLADGARAPRNARVVWVSGRLDTELMNAAAERLIGERDFASFADPKTVRKLDAAGRSTVRTLHALTAVRNGDRVNLEVSGQAFIHSQIRLMASALVKVGLGEHPPDWPAQMLAGRNRDGLDRYPARGLTFVGVTYPDDPPATPSIR